MVLFPEGDLGQFEKQLPSTAVCMFMGGVRIMKTPSIFYLNYLTGLLFLICFVFVLAIFCFCLF